MERLPTELAIEKQVREFAALSLCRTEDLSPRLDLSFESVKMSMRDVTGARD